MVGAAPTRSPTPAACSGSRAAGDDAVTRVDAGSGAPVGAPIASARHPGAARAQRRRQGQGRGSSAARPTASRLRDERFGARARRRRPIPAGLEPLAMTVLGNEVWVANTESNSLEAIDAASGGCVDAASTSRRRAGRGRRRRLRLDREHRERHRDARSTRAASPWATRSGSRHIRTRSPPGTARCGSRASTTTRSRGSTPRPGACSPRRSRPAASRRFDRGRGGIGVGREPRLAGTVTRIDAARTGPVVGRADRVGSRRRRSPRRRERSGSRTSAMHTLTAHRDELSAPPARDPSRGRPPALCRDWAR